MFFLSIVVKKLRVIVTYLELLCLYFGFRIVYILYRILQMFNEKKIIKCVKHCPKRTMTLLIFSSRICYLVEGHKN